MDCLTLIQQAERAGLQLEAAGEQVVIRGPQSAVAMVRQIAKHKREVLTYLRNDWAGDAQRLIEWCPDLEVRQQLADRFEETAATFEFTQGHTRDRAEMLAFGDLVVQLLRLNVDRPQLIDGFQEPEKPTD